MTEIIEHKPQELSMSDADTFAHMQRVAMALSSSELVPAHFRGKQNLANCLIALEMASRMKASPFSVMQQMYIVHGRPAWSSQFVIAAINSSGKFSALRFEVDGEGDERQCYAWAIEKETDEQLNGPAVSIEMAKKEGWHGKNGSKWQTMPDLMLRYRAATFFGRIYAPEIMMGMQTSEELSDIEPIRTRTKREPLTVTSEEPEPMPETETTLETEE
jgi:hypothetical protein